MEIRSVLMFDMVLLKFLAQGAAVDPEAGRRFRLIIVAVSQYRFQHGLFDLGNDRIKQVAGQFSVKIFQVLANSLLHGLLQ